MQTKINNYNIVINMLAL